MKPWSSGVQKEKKKIQVMIKSPLSHLYLEARFVHFQAGYLLGEESS